MYSMYSVSACVGIYECACCYISKEQHRTAVGLGNYTSSAYWAEIQRSFQCLVVVPDCVRNVSERMS